MAVGSASRRKRGSSSRRGDAGAAASAPREGGGGDGVSFALVGSAAVASVATLALIGWASPSTLDALMPGGGPHRRSVQSRPFDPDTVDENPDFTPDPVDVLREKFNVTVLSEDPLMLQFDDFLTPEEADGIHALASGRFQRSTTGLQRDRADVSRTSSTAWLIEPADYKNKLIKTIEDRMAGVMNVPAVNQEGFQVLEYEKGQYYKTHHDYLPEMETWPCGVRLATFYLYLSDVEEGGETHFPNINVTGRPKKGRAMLWYNIKKNSNGLYEMDGRTQHEAVPVKKGVKIGANKWVHVKDWVTPWRAGKTG